MARMTFAAIAAVLLIACGAQQAVAGRALTQTDSASACGVMTCPATYTARETSTDTLCDYHCERPMVASCIGRGRDPVVCGGTTGKTCPAFACSSATAVAISGPGGCARAQSIISSASLSQASYDYAYESIAKPVAQYCTGDPTASIAVTADKMANAYAKSVAYTFIYYKQFVCTCCKGNNLAYSTVSADVQAVASAVAAAYADLLLEIECLGTFVGEVSAAAEALAIDVQLAIDQVYKNALVSVDAGKCKADIDFKFEKAVAQATACTFVKILAMASYGKAPTLASCAAADALANFPNYHTCKYNFCKV